MGPDQPHRSFVRSSAAFIMVFWSVTAEAATSDDSTESRSVCLYQNDSREGHKERDAVEFDRLSGCGRGPCTELLLNKLYQFGDSLDLHHNRTNWVGGTGQRLGFERDDEDNGLSRTFRLRY